nr:odorant receptor 23a-like [Drosophila suzukii]
MELTKILGIDYFRYQLLVWRICGALDLCKGNYWSWAMGLNIFTFLQTPMLLKSIFSFEDPMDNIFNFALAITSLSTLLKFLMYLSQLNKLVDVRRIINHLESRVSGEDQVIRHRIMSRHLQRLTMIFLVPYGLGFLNASGSFLFKSERSLPLLMWFPFDWKYLLVAYLGALVFQLVGLFVQILHNFSGDSFPPVALYLVSEQCQLLILRISKIGYGSKNLKKNEQDLVNCIEDQITLYSLLELIQSMISLPMMIQFLVIGINTAVTLFGLIFYVEAISDRIFYVCFLLGLTLQTFPLCYYGTKVQESFEELHYAVFCSNWVDQSATYRGYMLILSERTKRQQILLAGNLVPINLSTFVACCKGAYSFFTLMADREGQGSLNRRT